MKIGIFAAGATAGFYGGKLALAGHDVHFIARGAHLEAIRKHGLIVESREHGDFQVNVPATDDPAEIGICDLILFSVKGPDLDDAVAALKPMVGPQTAIVPLLNGLDAPVRLREHYGDAALGGSCAIEAYIAEPGKIVNPSTFASITFGELGGGRSERAEKIAEVLKGARIQTVLSEDVVKAMWMKLLMLAVMSAFTTVARLPIGPLRGRPETMALMERMMREIYEVGRAEGVNLEEKDLEKALATLNGVHDAMRSSMQRDLEKGKPIEVDLIQGAVVTRADRHGMDVPVTRTMYGLLKAISP